MASARRYGCEEIDKISIAQSKKTQNVACLAGTSLLREIRYIKKQNRNAYESKASPFH